jgi:hypothetical protein
MNIVFISYVHEDREKAERLAQDLRQSGVKVWIDTADLTPGVTWRTAIRTAIKDSRYFIPLLSQCSIAKRGFFQKELREAIEVLGEYPDQWPYIVPARLEPCEPTFPELQKLQRVDLFPSWETGVRRIVATVSPEPVRDVQPPNTNGRDAPDPMLSRVHVPPTPRSTDTIVADAFDNMTQRALDHMERELNVLIERRARFVRGGATIEVHGICHQSNGKVDLLFVVRHRLYLYQPLVPFEQVKEATMAFLDRYHTITGRYGALHAVAITTRDIPNVVFQLLDYRRRVSELHLPLTVHIVFGEDSIKQEEDQEA